MSNLRQSVEVTLITIHNQVGTIRVEQKIGAMHIDIGGKVTNVVCGGLSCPVIERLPVPQTAKLDNVPVFSYLILVGHTDGPDIKQEYTEMLIEHHLKSLFNYYNHCRSVMKAAGRTMQEFSSGYGLHELDLKGV
ncbi:hypothetical protein Kuja_0650 [Vibrio phage vB_VchM_Kuja]|uniref:Uncharacterized protein n=1 Tax=Vibrio phage vB_VchM_Kuja TaxID=2686437 RepID=A0A6B9JAR8_9CAUD|nr:hypothetical protein HWC83_gp171 [Vibrio phage vB_VchM_Kuja]QGZ16056.1 hypothetical protein Kuja_0650 [Vibrio phage vB_VchM_Kuja]